MMTAPVVALAGSPPVATGNSRVVYRHPADAQLLIKLVRPDKQAWFRDQRFRWYQKRRRYGELGSFLQEVAEHLAVRAEHGKTPPHLQEIVGFTETDLGLGLVVRAVRSQDGRYAPTLATVVRSGGFDHLARRALEAFFIWLLGSRIVVSDLNWGNLLYAWDASAGAHRFVLVDGMGESAAFPLRSFAAWINRGSKKKKIAGLRAKIAANMPVVSSYAAQT
jgi:hypothetical protein